MFAKQLESVIQAGRAVVTGTIRYHAFYANATHYRLQKGGKFYNALISCNSRRDAPPQELRLSAGLLHL